MFGNGSLSAAIRKARLRLSRRAPEATIKRHGCTLEFEGARCAIANASSSKAGGTGRARKRRIDRRSRMTWSRIDACSRFCILSNLNRRTTPADSESSFLSNHSPKRMGSACRLLRFFSTELLLLIGPREMRRSSHTKSVNSDKHIDSRILRLSYLAIDYDKLCGEAAAQHRFLELEWGIADR